MADHFQAIWVASSTRGLAPPTSHPRIMVYMFGWMPPFRRSIRFCDGWLDPTDSSVNAVRRAKMLPGASVASENRPNVIPDADERASLEFKQH